CVRRSECYAVEQRDLRGECLRIAASRGRMLVLAAHMQRPAASLGQRGEAGDVVEAGLVRAAIVVEEGLAQMEAVLKNRAGDALDACVEGLQSIHRSARASGDVV